MTRTLETVALVMFSAGLAATAEANPAPAAAAARADVQKTLGFVPEFVRALPDAALPGYWAAVKGFEMNPKTAISNKEKDLIGLAVSAQTGNRYTIYSYTRCLRASGATPAEIGEAVAIAGAVRQMSTFMNGVQLDEGRFRAELARLLDNFKTGKAPVTGGKPARTTLEQVERAFGFVPEFIKKLPPEAQAAIWTQMQDLELNPKAALPGKTRSLISLAVAAQVPCRYCVAADTEFAKLQGASDREVAEAVTMAGLARQMGTLLDGMAVDEAAYRRDFDRIVAGAEKGATPVARTAK